MTKTAVGVVAMQMLGQCFNGTDMVISPTLSLSSSVFLRETSD